MDSLGHAWQSVVVRNATVHTPGAWIVDKEPTTDEEDSKHQECVDCGEILDTETILRLGYENHPAYMVGYPNGTFQPQVGNHLCEGRSPIYQPAFPAER